VDLKGARISFPIVALRCFFNGEIDLRNSRITFLNLEGSSVWRGVNLEGATIDGPLECNGAHFFSEPGAPALSIAAAKIEGNVLFRESFRAEGTVNLAGAAIGGNLECDSGQFVSNSEKPALDAYGAKIEGSVFLRQGFKADEGLDLRAVKIGQNLVCDRGQFVSKIKKLALDAYGAKIEGDVLFREGFRAEGTVNLASAAIGGNLECDSGQFVSNSEKPALDAYGAKIEGSVLFQGFKAEGGVDLGAVKIGQNLVCDSGRFVSKSEKPALDAYDAKIDRSVFLGDRMVAEGVVRFAHSCVTGDFQWNVSSPDKVTLDLQSATVGKLLNHKKSCWPKPGKLLLNGFVYDQIDDKADANPELELADVQLLWLHQQPRKRLFSSQPYEQLAVVLRKRGLPEQARKVMIEMNKDHGTLLNWRPAWLWYGFFGKLICYGYRPFRAFWLSLVVIGIGWLVFSTSYRSHLITPTDDKAYVDGKRHLSEFYPKFGAFFYSLESFVPLVRLGISDHWMPNANRGESLRLGIVSFPKAGSLLRVYLWLHMTLGWVLSALWVGAITGLVKTDRGRG